MTLYDHRLRIAREISGRLLERFGDHILAIGLHGSMAHQDADEHSDLDFHVVVDEERAVAVPSMWVDGVYVSISTKTAEMLLAAACEVDDLWAAGADRYVNKIALHDPDGCFDLVRRAHVDASSEDASFVDTARGLIFDAFEALTKARRYADKGPRVAAYVCLHEGLVALALTIGLLTRTRWRGTHLAVAGAVEAGREISGFSEPFRVASLDESMLSVRLQDAFAAALALRRHLERQGEVFAVRSVEELVG